MVDDNVSLLFLCSKLKTKLRTHVLFYRTPSAEECKESAQCVVYIMPYVMCDAFDDCKNPFYNNCMWRSLVHS